MLKIFLFINGEYIGAFNLQDILSYTDNDNFLIFDMNSKYHQYTQHVITQRRGLFEIELYFNNSNDYEMFIVDTGANITSVPYYDYIDLSTYKWSNYPFDENFNQIVDESLRKDFLLEFNNYFLGVKNTNVGMSNNSTFKGITISYTSGFYIRSHGCFLQVKSFLCPKDPREKKTIGISFFQDQIKRPTNSKLMGLDMLNQMHIKFSNEKMIISEYDLTDIRNYLNFRRNEYMVIILKSYIHLFYDEDKYEDIMVNFYSVDFSLKEVLEIDDIRTSKIKIKRNLRLIVVYQLNSEIINFIENTDNIDGYIIKSKYNLDIHLKDNIPLHLERNNSKENEYQMFIYNNEYEILSKYLISYWYLDHNFIFKKH